MMDTNYWSTYRCITKCQQLMMVKYLSCKLSLSSEILLLSFIKSISWSWFSELYTFLGATFALASIVVQLASLSLCHSSLSLSVVLLVIPVLPTEVDSIVILLVLFLSSSLRVSFRSLVKKNRSFVWEMFVLLPAP